MNKVRVAILGTGGFAGKHAQRLKSRGDVQIVGLCDVSEEIARGYLSRNLADYEAAPGIFTDPGTMIRQARPSALVIATPHTMHFEHAMLAVEAGLHVLVEKPMVTSAEQAHTLAAKVKEKGTILTIGYNTPCTPELNFVRDTIRNGSFGKLELVSTFLSQNWMIPTSGKWRQDPALAGGGQAYDSGAHLLNSLCWSVESDVAEVFAFVDNHGTRVDINSTVNVRFKNGVMAAIAIGGNCTDNAADMHFIFERGRIDTDGWGWIHNWIKVYQGGKEVKYPPILGEAQTPDDNFIDAILGKAEPKTSPKNGIVQSELMDAIYESARTGQPARPKR